MPLSSFQRKFLLIVLAALTILFQNCTGYKPIDTIFGKDLKSYGGEGYTGKVYANYGDCGNDQIGVKSVIRETSSGKFETLRQGCVDLPAPIATNSDLFRYSKYDQSVFVNVIDVYDGRSAVPTENKLTTAFCYADAADAGLEVMIWYNSQSFEGNADPRLATELFGRVTLPDQRTTGLVSFAPPQVFTDKLIYRSNPSAVPVELIETRSGVNSKVRFTFDGSQREVSVTCHAQAAPKFLEPDQGYFLKLSPELAAGGTQYAVLSHVTGNDLFKKTDESSPVASPNSLEGWNAGYLNISGKVYEMRKLHNGSICLGPGSDPRAPCEMQVLGTIKSADFANLYTNQNRYARTLTTFLKESSAQLLVQSPTNRTEDMISDYYKQCGASSPFPKHIDYWRSALDIQLASEVLVHLADPTEHRLLRAALLSASQALMNALPGDVLHFQTRECQPDNIEYGANILNALHHSFVATKLISIPSFLRSKGQYVASEMAFAKASGAAYRRDKLAALVSAMVVVERSDAFVYDKEFENFAVESVLSAQVLDASQAACDGTTLVFGGWKRSGSGRCGHDRLASARLVYALMDLHSFISARGMCVDNINCGVIQRSVLAYLAFHSKFPSSGVYEFDADKPLEQRLRSVPRLFGYAYRFGLKDESAIQITLDPLAKATLGKLRTEMISNSPTLNDYQNAVMSRGLLESRLAELTSRN